MSAFEVLFFVLVLTRGIGAISFFYETFLGAFFMSIFFLESVLAIPKPPPASGTKGGATMGAKGAGGGTAGPLSNRVSGTLETACTIEEDV